MSIRSRKMSAGWVSSGTNCIMPRTTLISFTRGPVQLIRRPAKAYRVRPDRRANARVPRHAERRPARTARIAIARSKRIWSCFERMKDGEFPKTVRTLAGQDRYGLSECQSARPGDVSCLARPPSSHRGQVVHLPDVRLGTWSKRFDRGHHPFDLHARIRRPSTALRLVLQEVWRFIIRGKSSSRD